MSDTLRRIVELVRDGNVRISAHGYDEMVEDGILAGEVIEGGLTANRPDPARWSDDCLRRK